MFIKPFKVKSNNQLKGTERKKLCEDIAKSFPTLQSEDIQSLVPKKDAVSILKVITHNGQICKVYCSGKLPMFFHLNVPDTDFLFPTIFTLWKYPDLLYTFTTREPVIQKLANGANLMLPGVVVDEPVNLYSYGKKMPKGTPVSIITDDNRASVAVGVTALSSEDMYMSGGHGKCVDIYHVIGDSLCQMDKPPPRPHIELLQKSKNNRPVGENQESSASSNEPDLNQSLDEIGENIDDLQIESEISKEPDPNNQEIDLEDNQDDPGTLESHTATDPVEEMDKLLEYCFLKACKVGLKKGDLPMITSTFFKNYVLSACPPGTTIDVKKSSSKKLSVFLASMKEKGLIETSVLKGVESLLKVNFEHPLLRELVINEPPIIREKEVSNAPVVSECFRVTANVLPLLSKYGYEKGDVLKRADIRKYFTEYVKSENLQNGKTLKINPLLAQILKTKENQESITMEDGINKFIGKMTHTHEITVGGSTILHSGKLEPIDITVATRSGNKKVTLINNLETFGIKLDEFSKECQAIGASATITDVPGKKTPSVLVQGNQVLYVYKLLTEKYRINKNHIRGLEFAPKKKK